MKNRLKELRKSKHLTMRKLGEEIGLDFSAISYFENGKMSFSANSLTKLANFFNVSIDYLLGYSQEEILNRFISNHYNDFVDVKIDTTGEAYEDFREQNRLVNLQFQIINIVGHLNNTIALENILNFAKLEEAKQDFAD